MTGSIRANAVGKECAEVDLAYIAGLIDGDGAIMALIEPHHEKKFRFRVRIELKVTQKEKKNLVFLPKLLGLGSVRKNRTTYDWITRDQKKSPTNPFDTSSILADKTTANRYCTQNYRNSNWEST